MFQRNESSASRLSDCTGEVPGGGYFQVFDQGAHIASWSPDGQPVLWVSEEAVFAPNQAIRGGIPICFPWFATGRDGEQTPAHGYARLIDWELTSATEVDGVTTLNWRLTDEHIAPAETDPARRSRYRFEATCRQVFGPELEITFAVRNTDSGAFSYEAALHAYFTVGDINKVSISGLAGADYYDKVLGEEDTQRGEVRFTGETDRVYQSTADTVIEDPELGRRIHVRKQNSANTVVWNPWVDKSAQMPDFGDDEWPGMVCVETANVLGQAIHLEAGESHAMSLTLAVEPLH